MPDIIITGNNVNKERENAHQSCRLLFPPQCNFGPSHVWHQTLQKWSFFPLQCCVFGKSVIINLPCNMNTYRAHTDTKGPSLDLWCDAACFGETEIKVEKRFGGEDKTTKRVSWDFQRKDMQGGWLRRKKIQLWTYYMQPCPQIQQGDHLWSR